MASFITCIGDFTRALPIYRLLPTPLYYRATKAILAFYNIGKKYLDSNMEKIQKCVEKGEKVKGQSLIEQWMLEKQMTEDEMIISAVGMFGAGVDTVNSVTGHYTHRSQWLQTAHSSISSYASLVLGLPQRLGICLFQNMKLAQ